MLSKEKYKTGNISIKTITQTWRTESQSVVVKSVVKRVVFRMCTYLIC